MHFQVLFMLWVCNPVCCWFSTFCPVWRLCPRYSQVSTGTGHVCVSTQRTTWRHQTISGKLRGRYIYYIYNVVCCISCKHANPSVSCMYTKWHFVLAAIVAKSNNVKLVFSLSGTALIVCGLHIYIIIMPTNFLLMDCHLNATITVILVYISAHTYPP